MRFYPGLGAYPVFRKRPYVYACLENSAIRMDGLRNVTNYKHLEQKHERLQRLLQLGSRQPA
jgi:hypothetical protein